MKKVSTLFFLLATLLAGAQSAKTITTNSQKDLIPEGIAVDATGNRIFISSIHRYKIIVSDSLGRHRDFISYNQDGFLEGLGMKVDRKKNLLWAVSNKEFPKFHLAQIHAFDLATGRKVHHFAVTDSVPRLFNDLDIAPDGRIYLTDMFYGAIYTIDPARKNLQLLVRDTALQYCNGIAFGKNNLLYVATYRFGPLILDLATKKITKLEGYTDGVLARNYDGLAYTGGKLIGVYNGQDKPFAVVQYTLDVRGRSVVKESLLDRGNPAFAVPTTLDVSGNRVYVLANSFLGHYNANKQSTKGIEKDLKPAVVVRYDLRP